MSRIVGLGGVFFKTTDVEASKNWYTQKLGIPLESWGGMFSLKPQFNEYQVFSIVGEKSEYLNQSQSFMINFVVEDLDAFCEILKSKDVPILKQEASDFGKFAWIEDLDKNKIELWEPSKSNKD
jgi:predicted enzyme related to lactoylglutathione lyase